MMFHFMPMRIATRRCRPRARVCACSIVGGQVVPWAGEAGPAAAAGSGAFLVVDELPGTKNAIALDQESVRTRGLTGQADPSSCFRSPRPRIRSAVDSEIVEAMDHMCRGPATR